MDLQEIINDSIKYPSSDWEKVLLLGVILVGFIFILPIILFFGYLFRIMKSTIYGADDLPDFDHPKEIFIDGLKVIFVVVAYSIPIWIISLFYYFLVGSTYIALDASIFAGLWSLIFGNTVLAISAAMVGLMEVMALANMAYYQGDLKAAFDFKEVLNYISIIGWKKYVISYVLIILIALTIFAIGFWSISIFIGIVILPLLIAPYLTIFVSRAVALLFTYAVTEAPK